MKTGQSQLRRTFFDEAAEHLAEMEQGFLLLESSPNDAELLQRLFRAAHSIKGGSGLFGYERVTRLTHGLEHILDRMRKRLLGCSGSLVDVLLRVRDALQGLLEAAAEGQADTVQLENLLGELARLGGAPVPVAVPAETPSPPPAQGETLYAALFQPNPLFFTEGIDPLLLLRNLSRRCRTWQVCANLDALPGLDELDPERCYLSWRLVLRSEQSAEQLREVFTFVEEACTFTLEAEETGEALPLALLEQVAALILESAEVLEAVECVPAGLCALAGRFRR